MRRKQIAGLALAGLAAYVLLRPKKPEEWTGGGFYPSYSEGAGVYDAPTQGPLAPDLSKIFAPPPDLSGYTQVGPRVAQPSKYETLRETGTRIGTIPVPPELIQQGDISEFERQKKDLDVAPSKSFLEKFLGIGFTPSPSGSTAPKQVGTYTPGPTPVSYPGELKSPGFDFGGSTIGGIGQSTIPTKYISGGSSSSSRKSSYGPIRYDTPSKAPESVEGIFTGGSSRTSSKKKSSGPTIRKTTSAERKSYEKQRKAKLKIR